MEKIVDWCPSEVSQRRRWTDDNAGRRWFFEILKLNYACRYLIKRNFNYQKRHWVGWKQSDDIFWIFWTRNKKFKGSMILTVPEPKEIENIKRRLSSGFRMFSSDLAPQKWCWHSGLIQAANPSWAPTSTTSLRNLASLRIQVRLFELLQTWDLSLENFTNFQ